MIAREADLEVSAEASEVVDYVQGKVGEVAE